MNPQVKDFINTVHRLDKLSIHHVIDFTPTEARAFALHADAHPQTASELRQMLKEIDSAMPRMNFGTLNFQPNRNNGRHAHNYKIGKEYSRVVYIETAKLSHPHFKDWNNLGVRLCAIGRQFGADETAVIENDQYGFSVRLWWD